MLSAVIMAVLNGWAGGSLWPAQHLKGFWTNAPELLFAAGIAYGSYTLFGWIGLLGVLSYFPLQSGTWIILPWRTKGVRNLTRGATLKPISDWIAKRFNIEFDTVAYAAIYAAVKGFLITLPIGGAGLVYMPLSYEIGQRISEKHKTLIAECVFGFFTGVNIWITTKLSF